MDKRTSDQRSQPDADPLRSDRTEAEDALRVAQDKPVLSGEQSCAVAQVHALLAIEQRLGHLCASIDAVLIALARGGNVGDAMLAAPA